jgi:DNA-binding transcriptional LysR family regulator
VSSFEIYDGQLWQPNIEAFGQVGAALDVRQSTLSRGLRDLELQLGATLFERTNDGTRPTVVEQEFLDAGPSE